MMLKSKQSKAKQSKANQIKSNLPHPQHFLFNSTMVGLGWVGLVSWLVGWLVWKKEICNCLYGGGCEF
jgi:hypothetical protein